MDETMVYIALAPFYAMAVWCCWLGIQYTMHKLQKLDESATETQMTETTSPASTQQK